MSDETVSVFGTNIASSIPLPAPLVLTKGNLAVSWRRFKDQFQTYEKATLLNAQPTSRRAAILPIGDRLRCFRYFSIDEF